MSSTLTASLFPAQSAAGLDLAAQIAGLLDKHGLRPRVLNRFESEVTMQDVVAACLTDRIVIFDATREDAKNNFDIAVGMLKFLPHVAVVSRNYLPVDFFGFTEGLYPSYIEESKTNESILACLETQLDSLLTAKAQVDHATVFHEDRKAIEIRPEPLRELKANRNPVFISSRSRYQRTAGEAPGNPSFRRSVVVLAEAIAEGQFGIQRRATFLEAGMFVYENELLTEHRRWQLLEQISSGWIRDCEEFWVYGSGDHFGSWWTLGELASFLALNRCGRLMVYDPYRDVVTECPRDGAPQLDLSYTNHLIHRFMLQTRAMLSAHTRQLRVLRKAAKLGQNRLAAMLLRPLLRLTYRLAIQHDGIPDGVSFDEYSQWLTSDYYLDAVVGRALESSFWDRLEFLVERRRLEIGKQASGTVMPSADFKKFFEFQDFDRIPLSKEPVDGQVLTVGDKSYVLRVGRPRFATASWGGQDYSPAGDNLAVLPMVRFFESDL